MRLLLVFLKEPIPGKVKTRLARDVGDEDAARFYRALVEVILRQLHGLQNCRIRFCYAPDDAADAIRFWLLPAMAAQSTDTPHLYKARSSPLDENFIQEIDFRPQGSGHLGERLTRAFDEGFSDGFSSICAIGTDCPECGSRWINAAFSRLESCDTRDGIIGPSYDGGYYLLGLNSPAPSLFQNIPWSESSVGAATLAAASESNMIFEKLPPLADVDHLEDWHSLLASPLGPAIKKALGEPLDSEEIVSSHSHTDED